MNSSLTVGERVQLQLEGWGRLGEALGTYGCQPVFVFGGISGEEVVAEVLKCRRRYIAARVVEVLSPSPHRVGVPCPYFGSCTGCQWQHIDYQYQLELKRQMVVDALSRVGGLSGVAVAQTLASPKEYEYRNHARLTVGQDGQLCYVNRETRQRVVIGECLLMDPWINVALKQLQGKCGETTQMSIRHSEATGDFLIQPTFRSSDFPLASGQKYYMDSVAGRTFRVASPSFFQINALQAERVLTEVKEGLSLTGCELLVDAYAGVGTFAILLAPYAGRVIAIEESASAVQDGQVNAEGIENIEFLQGKSEDVFAQMTESPYGVVLDPPRAGCHPRVLDALLKLKPQRIVYVSCDPATLARDLRHLCDDAFCLEQVQPIDMFPQTHHVECVATLAYRDTNFARSGHEPVSSNLAKEAARVEDADKAPLVLASASPRRRNLLPSLGLQFDIIISQIDERPYPGETPEEMVTRLARAKASEVAKGRDAGLVVGADSVVVLEGKGLGKPETSAQARQMLESLRGRKHEVITGVAVVDAATGRETTITQESTVSMREYSRQEMEDYVASGEPMDKAGAYAVQDAAFRPASQVEGCYTNVVGLPLCRLAELLKEMGMAPKAGIPIQEPRNCSLCALARGG